METTMRMRTNIDRGATPEDVRRPRADRHGQVAVGVPLPALALHDLDGRPVPVPDPERLVHLQLRRFAGCPVCNLHLRSVVARLDDIDAAGVREVVVFHSTVDALRPHAADLPFPVVADPDKSIYRALGVESSKRSILSPRVWLTIIRALAATIWGTLRGTDRPPSLFPEGGRYGLPGDFLVAPDGTVVAAKYGDHADDQWTVDELLALARRAG
jgi:peroxiredoxin